MQSLAQPGVMQSLAQPGIMQSLAQPGIMQSLADFEPEAEVTGGRAQQRGSRWGPREVELLGKTASFLPVLRIRIRIHSQRHGSADPDPNPNPHQNVMDPQHCFLLSKHFLRKCDNFVLVNFERLVLLITVSQTSDKLLFCDNHNQCCGSVTFLYGSLVPYLCLTDPDADLGGSITRTDPTDLDPDVEPEHR
jgi:hypothetical protein